MKKAIVVSLLVLLLAASATAAPFQNLVQGVFFTTIGGNNAEISLVHAEVSDAAVLDFLFTTSDTREYRLTADALAMGTNALEFGADAITSTWSMDYVAANKVRIADSDIVAWGAGDDALFASDGTNFDITVGLLLTIGDGGSTNFISIDLDGDMLVAGSGSINMDDNVELHFGTAAAESQIVSNGTDTTFTVISGDLVLGTDAFLTRIEGAFQLGAVSTMGDSDDSPDVGGNTYWNTGTVTDTIIDFDAAGAGVIEDGVIIFVVSKAAITYDVTTSGLKGGSADLVTADGDLTVWLYDGTDWILLSFTDQSDNLS